ncbi:MAG: hypothetical protein HYX56_04720 [Chloroflexi bacterium]|nr:hypothetical protein [Chloroflexota bacterium]
MKPALEHPTQGIASAFLRAIADGEPREIWERLSRETRGLLEGMHAQRSGLALHETAAGGGDERIAALVAPLRATVLDRLGGAGRVLSFGVSGARIVDRQTAYVLLLPDVGHEGLIAESEWRPSHLIAFVSESGAPLGGSKEWLVDLGRTASLSADAGLPDPLGAIR